MNESQKLKMVVVDMTEKLEAAQARCCQLEAALAASEAQNANM